MHGPRAAGTAHHNGDGVYPKAPLVLKPLVQLVHDMSELLEDKPTDFQDRFKDMVNAFRLMVRKGLVCLAMAGIDMAL